MAQFARMGAVLALGAVALWVLALPKYSAAHVARRIVLVIAAIGIPWYWGLFLNSSYAVSQTLRLSVANFVDWNLGILACKIGVQVSWTETECVESG